MIPLKLIPFRLHAFRPDRSSTLDMNLVKSLILRNAGYMICLVHVKDNGVFSDASLEPTKKVSPHQSYK